MLVVGMDGLHTPRGIPTVVLEQGELYLIRLARSLDDALEAHPDAAAIAINLPLDHDDPDGTRNRGIRRCDAAARRHLGARAEQIRPVPPPSVLAGDDLDAAQALARAKGWPTPDERLWRVRGRARRAQEAARRDARLHEVHPELSFTVLLRAHAGPEAGLEHSRTASWAAQHERLALLHRSGLRPARSMGGIGRMSPEDVLAATVAAWSAHRIATRSALRFPEASEEDTPRLWA